MNATCLRIRNVTTALVLALPLAQCAATPSSASACLAGQDSAYHDGHARNFVDLHYAWTLLRREGLRVDDQMRNKDKAQLTTYADSLCHTAEGIRAMSMKVRLRDRKEFVSLSDTIIRRSIAVRELRQTSGNIQPSPSTFESEIDALKKVASKCFFKHCRY